MTIVRHERIPPRSAERAIRPSRADIGIANEICEETLRRLFRIFESARRGAAQYRRDMSTVDQIWLRAWTIEILSEHQKLEKLVREAGLRVLPLAKFFDRCAVSTMKLQDRRYSTVFEAIANSAEEFLQRGKVTFTDIAAIRHRIGNEYGVALALKRHAMSLLGEGIAIVGDLDGAQARLEAELRLQAAKAIEATVQSPSAIPIGAKERKQRAGNQSAEPKLAEEEKMVVDALKKARKRMTQEKLLPAARLKITGSNKSLLANMVQREVLDNRRDELGRGYGLPEWHAKKRI